MNFQNEFERETQHLPVPDTEIATVITTARSRTRRRRVAVSTLAAGVLIAGTAVGIQQLSTARHTDTDFAVPPTPAPEPSSTESTTATVETNDAGTATTVSGWSMVGEGTDPTLAFLESKATSAQAVPANITWTVLDANSPEALAYQFDSTQRYALATVPATSPVEMVTHGLFEQVNGKWNQVPFEYPEGLEPFMSGDTVYGFGRAPATPGGPIGSFGTFDIASGTWRLHELPAELGVYESDAVTSEMYYQVVPVDDGLIVYVSSWTQFRSEKVQQMFSAVAIGPVVDGNSLVAFNDCDSEMDAALANSEEALNQEIYFEFARKYCTEESIDTSEIGLTQADFDALKRSQTDPYGTTLWKVTADSMVPFDVPGHSWDDQTSYVSLDGEQILVSGDGPDAPTTIYLIDHDGSLHQVFKDLTGELESYSTKSSASPDYSTVIGGVDQFLLMERSGGPTQITDVLSIAASPDMIRPRLSVVPVGVSGPLSVFDAQLAYDPPGTLTEQKSLSDSGYTLKLNDGMPLGYEIVEDATGEPPSFNYGLSTESGKVQLARYPDPPTSSDDSQAASMTEDPTVMATFDVDWRTMPGLNMKWRSNVLTTTDGVNVAMSDVESILRQSVTVAENETVYTGSANVFNGRILVDASVYAPVESVDSSDGPVIDTERPYLVVGTPN